MRAWAVCTLTIILLSGCLNLDAGPTVDAQSPVQVDVWRPTFEGSDLFVPGAGFGTVVRVTNPNDIPLQMAVLMDGALVGSIGVTSMTSGAAPLQVFLSNQVDNGRAFSPSFDLEPGASRLVVIDVRDAAGDLRLQFLGSGPDGQQVNQPAMEIPLAIVESNQVIQPGDLVQTNTVGFLPDGQGFYTNIASLESDANFTLAPGFEGPIDGTPLPVYVFDSNRDEQPEATKDQCYFTTINGYNALLKTQREGSVGVRYLNPSQAYTVDGAEDHPLFGAALIFVNVLTAFDRATTQTDALPDPTGDCFANRLDDLPLPLR